MRSERAADERLSSERARLLALARALVHDRAEADDVVHEVLVTALGRDEPLREAGPWLRQVLRNEVRGRARKRARREARAAVLVESVAATSHEDTAARREIARVVWDVLDQLEEPYRETLRRRFLDEQSPSEIAGLAGDPPSTVRWRIHEGIRRLRRRLDERFGGRAQWCGGFAVVVGLPTATPVKGLVGSMSTALKIVLVLVATALGAAAVASSMSAESNEPSEVSESLLEGEVLASLTSAAHRPATTPDREATELRPLASQPSESTQDDPKHSFGRAIRDCIEGAPAGSLSGLERLELDFLTYGAEEGTIWYEINVTTGREMPDYGCSDPPPPLDLPEVIYHDEIRSCLLATADPSWLSVPAPFFEEYSGIGGVIVLLDGEGGIKPKEPSSKQPLSLPDVSEEPPVDPQRAVEAFGLRQRGPSDAKLQVVVCGSYDCSFSRRSEATLAEARELYPDLATAWLAFPLSGPSGMASRAALAADRQGQFWAMHDGLFELFETNTAVERSHLVALAEGLGLDMERFATDLDDEEIGRMVARHRQSCKAAGAWATPTFFINGDMLRGEVGLERLAAFVDEVVELEQ